MIYTLTKEKFVEEFNRVRPNQFSIEALESIFDFFEDTGEDVEFDPIGICCDFSEYESMQDYKEDTGDEYNDTIEDLEQETLIIPLDNGGFVAQDH